MCRSNAPRQSVRTLLEQSPSSGSLLELWKHILEEERTLSRRFEARRTRKTKEKSLSAYSSREGVLGCNHWWNVVPNPASPAHFEVRTSDERSYCMVPSTTRVEANTLPNLCDSRHVWSKPACCLKQGRLLSWGTGQHGELGLGPHVPQRRTPCVVRSLSSVAVATVVAGAAHVLCATLDGKVRNIDTNNRGRANGSKFCCLVRGGARGHNSMTSKKYPQICVGSF